MVLASGTRLGPYEVIAPLGSGGMGEVYRARDPRLSREVAIKLVAAPGPRRIAPALRGVRRHREAHPGRWKLDIDPFPGSKDVPTW